jgi:TonB family protein
MTFRHSLYLSITAHLLIFGSAIAIAQHGRGLFLPDSHMILVSLVAPGSEGGEDTATIQRQIKPSRAVSRRPVDVSAELPQTGPPESPSDLSAETQVPDEVDTAATGTVGDDVGADIHGQAIAYAGDGKGESARIGIIEPKQWSAIQAAIERTKNYPRLARERGIQGVVHLRFRIDSAGGVETVEVVKSSGYEILDTASVRAVYRAAPMPLVQGWIEVPIAYVLKKQKDR